LQYLISIYYIKFIKKIFILLVLLLAFSSLVQAQVNPPISSSNGSTSSVMPIGNSGAMANQTNNVDMSTGGVSLSIPIYSLGRRQLSTNVSLSYQTPTSSFWYDEYPSSWVGRDWVLNAGGVITKEIYPNSISDTSIFPIYPRDRKHYEAIIVIGRDGKEVKQYITEKLNRGFGEQMSSPYPETTTGWRKGTSYTGPNGASEQVITFLNKEKRVGEPIVAISSNAIRKDFVGDVENISTTIEQYLAYTMLHGLGHGAGIGEQHINNRWLDFNIPSIMMGGSRNRVSHSIAAMRESNKFYSSATSFNNNIIYYQFMFNYYIMGNLWGVDQPYPAYKLGPFSRFAKNLLQYID